MSDQQAPSDNSSEDVEIVQTLKSSLKLEKQQVVIVLVYQYNQNKNAIDIFFAPSGKTIRNLLIKLPHNDLRQLYVKRS